jgi:hypothetical protein
VELAVFPHNTEQPSGADLDSSLLQHKLHARYTIVIVIFILVKDTFDGRRKSLILTGFSKVLDEPVISGFANIKDFAENLDRPGSSPGMDELIALMCSYFFRLSAKKPRASLRISLARLSSRFSFSRSRIR